MSSTPKYFPDENFLTKKAEKFVPTMETSAAASLDRFRFRLVMHIALGYALYLSAVFVALLFSLLAIYAAFVGRAFWLAGAALGSLAGGIGLLQGLHVEIPPPKGIPIAREDAPGLYETVDQLVAKSSAPTIDAILLIPEPNATIASRYANGLFGRTSTTLRLGLPLMHLLSPSEFRALLHHEIAHSSEGHGHFGIWTARVWESWSQLPLIDQEMGFSARLILPPIYRWFAPKFMAYSAVLSRIHEFAADRNALTHASDSRPDLMLFRVGLAGQFMGQRFWPEIWKDARDLPRTPPAVFSRLPGLAKTVSALEIREWVKLEIEQTAGLLDFHPDLRARLKALGSTVDPEQWTRTIAELGFAPEWTAAAEYFENCLPRYESALTEKWAQGSFLLWEDVFKKFDHIRKRLAELQESEKSGALNAEQQTERAVCVWNLEGPAAAESLLMATHAAFPDDPGVTFTLGRCLLAQDKEDGVILMEHVIDRASSTVRYQGTTEICQFLKRHNRHDEAAAFYNRMVRENAQQQEILQERINVSTNDTVIAHDLDPAASAQLCSQVAEIDWVIAAYVCKKLTALSPGRPLYLLALKARRGFLIPAFRAGMTAFDQVAALNCCPNETRFLLLDGSQPSLEKRIRKLPGSLLFKR